MPKSPDAFRTISEVSEWLEVPAHVLRFWESKFAQVKPVKRAGGRRYYRPSDMELLGGIKKLLYDDGLTIRGVQKKLREDGIRSVASLSGPVTFDADIDAEAEPAQTEPAKPTEAATEPPLELTNAQEAAPTEAEAAPAPDEAEAEAAATAEPTVEDTQIEDAKLASFIPSAPAAPTPEEAPVATTETEVEAAPTTVDVPETEAEPHDLSVGPTIEPATAAPPVEAPLESDEPPLPLGEPDETAEPAEVAEDDISQPLDLGAVARAPEDHAPIEDPGELAPPEAPADEEPEPAEVEAPEPTGAFGQDIPDDPPDTAPTDEDGAHAVLVGLRDAVGRAHEFDRVKLAAYRARLRAVSERIADASAPEDSS